MQSLDSLYSQTRPVKFHNRAMRQKCLEFIIYMFITKWDKENSLNLQLLHVFFLNELNLNDDVKHFPVQGFKCWNR